MLDTTGFDQFHPVQLRRILFLWDTSFLKIQVGRNFNFHSENFTPTHFTTAVIRVNLLLASCGKEFGPCVYLKYVSDFKVEYLGVKGYRRGCCIERSFVVLATIVLAIKADLVKLGRIEDITFFCMLRG